MPPQSGVIGENEEDIFFAGEISMKHRTIAAVFGALAAIVFAVNTASAQGWNDGRRWDNDRRWDDRDRGDWDRRGDRGDRGDRWGDPRGWRWETLGCQDVNFRVDRDQIRISRHDGPFRALRLKAHHGDVEMFNLRVVYRDGFAEEVPVRSWIRAGRETRPLDLRAGTRGIRGVEMVYRSVPDYRGRAAICVEALY